VWTLQQVGAPRSAPSDCSAAWSNTTYSLQITRLQECATRACLRGLCGSWGTSLQLRWGTSLHTMRPSIHSIMHLQSTAKALCVSATLVQAADVSSRCSRS
jgi:hypothetical protein